MANETKYTLKDNNKAIAERIADRAIAMMEQGNLPWNKPWCNGQTATASNHNFAYNGVTKKAYAGINQLLLKPGEYRTFKQWTEAGGKIKKGSHGHEVVYWSIKAYPIKDEDGNDVVDDKGKAKMRNVWILKSYMVFHIDDVDGVKKATLPRKKPDFEIPTADAVLDDYIKREHIDVFYGGNRACYSPAADDIHLPEKSQFKVPVEFYSTAYHEMAHSTGHTSRLNRDLTKISAFGDETYSKEELVAEISAATLLATLGLETADTFRNSAAYLQSWLKALRNDKSMLLAAATKADKAVEYILTGKKHAYNED